MPQVPEPYAAALRIYRTQYGPARLILGAFGLVMGIVLVAKLIEPLSKTAGMVVLGIAGVAFTLMVATIPITWRWWSHRGGKRLVVANGKVALVEPRTGEVLRETALRPDRVERAEFHFEVTTRFGSGLYRAPLLAICFDDDAPIYVGAERSPLTWRGPLEVRSAPAYVVDAPTWQSLVAALGLAHELVAVTDVRVG